jgi:Zn finger protein HypA/HybF involved in hydrogenase expression
MKKIQYTTKTGKIQFKPQVSMRQMENIMSEGGTGWCLHCGTEVDGCEPDARRYTCESCKQPKVYGLEELLMMGLVSVK